jgi:hypothetical protein
MEVKQMEISFTIEKDIFTDSEKESLKINLGITEEQLPSILSDLAKTAFIEYKNMVTDHGIPDKAAEVREERLGYLIKYFYKDHIPKESEIQTVFQLSSTASKTLLKNTRSKKRTLLEEQIKKTVIQVLNNATPNGDKYTIEIKSENLLQEINELISEKGAGLHKVTAVRNVASLYDCPIDTMNLLKSEYGIS